MSDAPRPLAGAHRGSVVAVGFVIDADLVGVREARRRVLAVWRRGARVSAGGARLAITELPARRVRVSEAPGTPLCEQAGLLTAAPLRPADVESLARRVPPGTVIDVAGGVAIARRWEAEAIDVGAWLELDALTVVEVAALAAPPASAVIPIATRPDLRARAGLGAPAGDAAAAGVAIVRAADAPGPTSWWRRLAHRLAARLERAKDATGDGRASRGADAATSARASGASHDGGRTSGPPAPGLVDRLRARLAGVLWRSWFGGVLGRQHARHLQRTLELFDRGDLDEALRRAMPLGARGPVAGLALGIPAPRTELAPSTRRPAGITALPVSQTADELLRARYRAAYERLVREGRIDVAAFVLADLLGEVHAAVDLLERHGRHALAAEVAEGHQLDGALIARLWFHAGDRARAIAAARRHDAWAAVIVQLERRSDTRADEVRWLWAEHLAAIGAEAAAVDVVWQLREQRRAEVWAWSERGRAHGGPAAARLLAKQLVLAPERFGELSAAVRALLADREPDAAARRRALADQLIDLVPTPERAAVARAVVRALWRDAGRGDPGVRPATIERLLRAAADPALGIDRPAMVTAPVPATSLADRQWLASDVGQIAIEDAAVLPDGRLLVALGELGARLLRADGRVLAHFDQPASELVVADHGGRALAVARRERFVRVARLDLAARRAAPWTVAECDGGARTYDGDRWLTWRGGEVLAIDVTAERWTALWGVDTRSAIRGVDRDGDHVAVVTASEVWFHEKLVLRRRRELDRAPVAIAAILRVRVPPGQGDWVVLARTPEATPRLVVWASRGPFDVPYAPPLAFEVGAGHVALATAGVHGAIVRITDTRSAAPTATLTLDGAGAVTLRFVGELLVIGDDRGRLLVVELATGALRADLRLRA